MNLLSTHGVVLAAIARQPDIRLRDLATTLDVTERTIWRAVDDLVASGVITRRKTGRRNSYEVVHSAVVGDGIDVSVGALLNAISAFASNGDRRQVAVAGL